MKIVLLTGLLAFSGLMGCYKNTVQQGNILKQEDIDEVKPGISKQQAAIILGTPTVADPFDQDRWDYINTIKSKGKFKKIKKFSLFFEDNKLIRTEGNYYPEDQDTTIELDDDQNDSETDS